MSGGKHSFLMLGPLAALLVAAALWLSAGGWVASWQEAAVWAAIALSVGGVVTAVQMVHAHRLQLEVDRLMSFVDGLARTEVAAPPPFRSRFGLDPVAESASGTFDQLRQRVKQLVAQRRELEVQVRIADAERRHGESILNSIADAVVVTDAFNEIALANEAAARVLGFDRAPARRQPVDRIVRDAALVKLIKDTRAAGDASLRRHVEHRMSREGREETFDVTVSCLAAANGDGVDEPQAKEAAGVVTILRDITREREIAEMKSDFVSAVSHELRTPLSSIKAYLEMLVDGEAQDEQTRMEFYNIIQGETNRLSRLIDNILNISRIESGVVKVQREHISLPAVVHEVVEVMKPQARAKNIELDEAPTPLYFQVFADKDMIYQATMNLVGNAIKYTPEGGRVSVSIGVDEHARSVQVSVEDSGVGIPPEDVPHLFTKFFRVAEHKKLAKGTGLGLNLVKQIVETVHGGRVQVQSQVGRGSRFTFCLPMADQGV